MNAIKVLETALTSTQFLLNQYVSDLSDADLLVRPVPGANHIAWQLGHVIASEIRLVKGQLPNAAYPELPSGFAEQHGKETQAQDPPKGFLSKQQYVDLFNKVREATKATASKLSDTDLDRPNTAKMPPPTMAPTLGAVLANFVNHHTLMHAAQFSVVRRKLGKPVLF